MTEQQPITLSTRQTQCLVLMVRDFSTKQIAFELGISTRTVLHYITDLKAKFDVTERPAVVGEAVKQNILKWDSDAWKVVIPEREYQ